MGIFCADSLDFADAGFTLANTFSHLWCSPEGTGRPPEKLSFIMWASDIPATNIIRQFEGVHCPPHWLFGWADGGTPQFETDGLTRSRPRCNLAMNDRCPSSTEGGQSSGGGNPRLSRISATR